MTQYRKAECKDLDAVMQIIAQAQAQLRDAGSTQWQDGYPAIHHIKADIECGYGIVVTHPDNDIIAYAAMTFDGEPAYAQINGAWIGDTNYAVIHRLAVADKTQRQGTASALIRYALKQASAQGVGSFRIDTAHENHIMQHLLTTLGFSYCGEIYYASGPRMAFEKLL